MQLTKAIHQIDRRYVVGMVAYGLLTLLSCGWIALTDWWNLSVTDTLPELQFAVAALGFGMAFWALVAGFAYCVVFRLDQFGRRMLAVVGSFLCVFVVLNWPGFLDADSVATISDSRTVPYTDWLGTAPVVIGAVLHHIPLLGALTLIQSLFLALAVAYALQTLREHEGKVAAWTVLGLLAVSLPTYYATLLVVRETWLAIASLFVAVECVRFLRDPEWTNGQTFGRLLAWTVVAWYFRSESILYFAAAIGFAGLRLVLAGERIRAALDWRALSWKSFAPALAALALTQAILPVAVRSYPQSAAYDITLWIEPVGDILSNNPEAVAPEARETVYEFIAPEVFSPDWNNQNILDKFWNPWEAKLITPPETAVDRDRLNRAATDVMMSDPARLVDNRLRAFNATNAPNAAVDEVAVQPGQVFVTSPRAQAAIAGLEGDRTYGGWFNPLRQQVERLFASTETAMIGASQWAIYPDILALVLVALLFPWAPGYALAAVIVLSRIPPLFLLMPAPQSKYFFPGDIVVPFLVVGAAMAVWSRLRASHRKAMV